MNTVKQNQVERRKTWRKISMIYMVCMCAKSLQLHPTLCDPMDCCPPGSSVHGILQARILEWVAIPFSRGSSQPREQNCISCIGRWGCLSLGPPEKPLIWYPLVLFTQEYIDELPVLRNILAHKGSPDCGLCKSLLRMDQFFL